jgi:hypothetical protein
VCLGREERMKELITRLIGHACAMVNHGNLHTVTIAGDFNLDRGRLTWKRCRFDCVLHQGKQHVLNP